jgi:cobalamin 5'-phosphate synthase/cobalamin synthase
VKSFLAAVAFLTRIPVGLAFDGADVSAAGGWFPVVGVLLGTIYYGVAAALKGHLTPMATAALLIALDALLTGALHWDGLADTADGLGGGRTADDALRIMRDHAIGSYGGVALAVAILLKTAACASLIESGRTAALILVPALGRWSILLLTAALPYARSSRSVIEGMGRRALIHGTVPLTALVVWQRAWAAPIVALAVSAGFGWYCRRRIGGITGDTLGANLQLCESAALLVFAWTP